MSKLKLGISFYIPESKSYFLWNQEDQVLYRKGLQEWEYETVKFSDKDNPIELIDILIINGYPVRQDGHYFSDNEWKKIPALHEGNITKRMSALRAALNLVNMKKQADKIFCFKNKGKKELGIYSRVRDIEFKEKPFFIYNGEIIVDNDRDVEGVFKHIQTSQESNTKIYELLRHTTAELLKVRNKLNYSGRKRIDKLNENIIRLEFELEQEKLNHQMTLWKTYYGFSFDYTKWKPKNIKKGLATVKKISNKYNETAEEIKGFYLARKMEAKILTLYEIVGSKKVQDFFPETLFPPPGFLPYYALMQSFYFSFFSGLFSQRYCEKLFYTHNLVPENILNNEALFEKFTSLRGCLKGSIFERELSEWAVSHFEFIPWGRMKVTSATWYPWYYRLHDITSQVYLYTGQKYFRKTNLWSLLFPKVESPIFPKVISSEKTENFFEKALELKRVCESWEHRDK